MPTRHPATSGGPRAALSTALLGFAFAGWLVAVISLVLVVAAGSRLVNDDPDSAGPMRIFLSRFSLVTFKGFVPDPQNHHSFLVTFHLFLTSFGWEFPSALSKSKSAGFVNPTYSSAGLYLPTDLVRVGERLGLDSSAWACLPPDYAGRCTNPFYFVFHRQQVPWKSAPGLLTFIAYMSSLCVAIHTLIVEVLIVYRPGWLECRCYFSGLKRICPCPRGQPHEIALLPPSFWDRYRLWVWAAFPLIASTAGMDAMFSSESLVMLLRSVIEKDHNTAVTLSSIAPQMGSGFATLTWTSIAASFASTMLLLARLVLSHTVPNWMEREVLGLKEEGL
ncbi:hypothetical protein ACJ41O_006918 [Fusarium nematophilum]